MPVAATEPGLGTVFVLFVQTVASDADNEILMIAMHLASLNHRSNRRTVTSSARKLCFLRLQNRLYRYGRFTEVTLH